MLVILTQLAAQSYTSFWPSHAAIKSNRSSWLKPMPRVLIWQTYLCIILCLTCYNYGDKPREKNESLIDKHRVWLLPTSRSLQYV